MTEELHLASLVVHAHPNECAVVGAAIADIPAARIHGIDPSGKLVVTLEGPAAGVILEQVTQIQQTPGVIGVALVYQHAEPLESMNVEMPDEYTT